jgi:hypothetical protein
MAMTATTMATTESTSRTNKAFINTQVAYQNQVQLSLEKGLSTLGFCAYKRFLTTKDTKEHKGKMVVISENLSDPCDQW